MGCIIIDGTSAQFSLQLLAHVFRPAMVRRVASTECTADSIQLNVALWMPIPFDSAKGDPMLVRRRHVGIWREGKSISEALA